MQKKYQTAMKVYACHISPELIGIPVPLVFLRPLVITLKVDFHSVEYSERTENLLFMRGNIALNLKRVLRMKKLLLKIASAQEILLSGNQP